MICNVFNLLCNIISVLLRVTSGARNPNLNIGYKRMRGSYIGLH